MTRIRLTIAYDGARFLGWQLQREEPTVQGVVEAAVAGVLGAPVRVHGAGRTDSGVHARGQVAHFDLPRSPEGQEDQEARWLRIPWRRALNARLPVDVRVLAAEVAPPGFHARFWAREKTYAYTLWREAEYVLPQRRRYVWACGPLDEAAMDRAAAHFLGRRDFAAVQNAGTVIHSTVRTVLELTRGPGQEPPETVWRIRADGFLKQMVRNILGCLVAVGRGRLDPDAVPGLLDGGDRRVLPPTAPACGLTLESIVYGDGPRPREAESMDHEDAADDGPA
ncbi:MAG: tRNA pseudouridine(38-40) synthase TruA [Desulfovibrionaceae bacterium]